MALPDEKTISFDLWPNMLMIEGASRDVGALIEMLYDDPAIPADAWNVQQTMASRKTYALSLQDAGDEKIRQGMGIRPDSLVPFVESQARSLGLQCFRLSTKSRGAF